MKEELKLIKITPNIEQYKIFFNTILKSNLEIEIRLEEKLHDLNKKIEELSIEDITIIEKELFWKNLKIYNLVNTKGEFCLPFIYTNLFYGLEESPELFPLSKYDTQFLDIINKYGKVLYEDAIKKAGKTPETLYGPALWSPANCYDALLLESKEYIGTKKKEDLGDDVAGLLDMIEFLPSFD
jgi:hypothetical protein